MKRFLIVLLILFCGLKSTSAETIKGSACYHFSDNETINQARNSAFTLAIADAIVRYRVFVESTNTVVNRMLNEDLNTRLTTGLLKNSQIVSKTDDLQNRDLCMKIMAQVNPNEIKKRIDAKVKILNEKIRKSRNDNSLKNESNPKIEFSFEVDAEGSPVSGRGWAILENTLLKGHIFLNIIGDETGFSAGKQ